jgi:hypothetical protein
MKSGYYVATYSPVGAGSDSAEECYIAFYWGKATRELVEAWQLCIANTDERASVTSPSVPGHIVFSTFPAPEAVQSRPVIDSLGECESALVHGGRIAPLTAEAYVAIGRSVVFTRAPATCVGLVIDADSFYLQGYDNCDVKFETDLIPAGAL